MTIQPVREDGVDGPCTSTGNVPPCLSQSVEPGAGSPNCGAVPSTAGIGRMICLLAASPATEWIVRGLPVVTVVSLFCDATKTVWSSWSVFESTIPSTSGPVRANGTGTVRQAVLQDAMR